jgi:competence protein ComFC
MKMMMLGLLRDLFDLIFPPHESVRIIRDIGIENFKTHYRYQKLDSGLIALANYHDPLIQAAVTANKFHNSYAASKLLASLLEAYLKTQTQSTQIWLVPIPLSRSREQERGYNQVMNIIKNIELPHCKTHDILIRMKHTKPQTSLNRIERLNNMAGAFAISKKASTPHHEIHIIIIDDVTTTGATLKAAYKILRKNLPDEIKVTTLAIAH